VAKTMAESPAIGAMTVKFKPSLLRESSLSNLARPPLWQCGKDVTKHVLKPY